MNKPWWTSDSPGVINTVFFADRLFYWRTARYPSCRNREPLIPDPIGGTPTPATTMLTETVSFSARATNNGADLSGNYRRIYADIRALDHALISEDLPAARDAFNRLQKDSPLIAEAVSQDPVPLRSRPLRALKALGRCLLRGNLSGARRAFELFA